MKNKAQLILFGAGSIVVALLCVAALYGGSGQGIRDQSPPAAMQAPERPAGPAPGEPSAAKHDREVPEGLQAALDESDPERRRMLLARWADGMDVAAKRKEIANIDSSGNTTLRLELRGALLWSWARQDLGSLGNWFNDRGRYDETHQQTRDVLIQYLVQCEPASAMGWMAQSLPESVRKEIYSPYFREWVDMDPAAASAGLIQAINTGDGLIGGSASDLILQVAAQWAAADPNAAASWVKSLPEGEAKSKALVQISYAWMQADPRQAMAYATQDDDPSMVKVVVSLLTQKDPRSAAAWASQLPDKASRDAASVSVAQNWADKDPAAAAEYAAGLPDQDARAQASLAVADSWAYTNPQLAAAWISQFPEGAVREQALGQIMSAWGGNDANAAAQWLQRLPKSPSGDAAVSAFSSVVAPTNPQMAFQWAGTIPDAALRIQELRQAAVSWLANDPISAQAPIAQSNLPEDIKRQLLGH